jgi:hypothetical protein
MSSNPVKVDAHFTCSGNLSFQFMGKLRVNVWSTISMLTLNVTSLFPSILLSVFPYSSLMISSAALIAN